MENKSHQIVGSVRKTEGSVVTVDAVGATKNIMEAICGNGRDFVLQMKRNSPALYEELMQLFDGLADENFAGKG